MATAYLADKFARKSLILVSLLGSACGLLSAAFFHHIYHCGYESASYDWIPVVCLSTVIFLAAAGIEPLFYVCSVENLPAKVRGSRSEGMITFSNHLARMFHIFRFAHTEWH